MPLLLSGWLVGCATDTDLQGVQVDTALLARQQSERHQTMDVRMQQLNERVGRFTVSQEETQRGVARVAKTVDSLRVQLQRLQADVQETLHRVQRSDIKGEEISDAKLAAFENRLGEVEKQLRGNAPASNTPAR
jgi:hypothetical protein